MSLDPREALVRRRLEEVGHVIAVCSNKGGVGKSLIAASLSYVLSRRGLRVGCLDLDMYSSSLGRVLGLNRCEVRTSERGVEPCVIDDGLSAFSVSMLIGDRPVPLRGQYRSELVLDLLSKVAWRGLDVLVIDMPPGTGDELIMAMRYIREKLHALVVMLPDVLSIHSVRKLVQLLREHRISILGAIVNMSYVIEGDRRIDLFRSPVRLEDVGVEVLEEIPFDPCVPSALGEGLSALSRCSLFMRSIESAADKIVSKMF